MALWTFRAQVIPREALGDCRKLSEAQFDDLYPLFWEKCDGEDVARQLLAMLPPLNGWDENLTLVGFDGGDRIEVWREKGRVANIMVKIDCRAPNLAFVDALEGIGAANHLLFICDRTFDVCEPGRGALRQFVLSSASRRALFDPERWLPYLAEEVRKRETNE
jgi:hypothetical protein